MLTVAAIAALKLIAPAAGAQEVESRTEARVMILNGPGGEGGLDRDGDGAMDTDDDGRVSEAEFLARMGEAFRRMDADSSGYLEDGEHGPQRIIRRERVEE